jgi:hypothetical protein
MVLRGRGRTMTPLAGFLAVCCCGGPDDGPSDPGALVRVTMQSQVGVLLDELPADMRERVARDLLDQGPELWTQRAQYQIEHTLYRLVFRQYFYEEGSKLQLPLPPRELWTITVDPGGAQRTQIAGHDMIAIAYTLDTVLLSDAWSPGEAEPALAEAGGTWDEPFVLPVDPMLLLQRTGHACMDESGFPPHELFEENARWFYNHTCAVEDPGEPACHQSAPEEVTSSCIEALDSVVGKVETVMHFERLAWDPALADRVRVGTFTKLYASDLAPAAEALENHWLVYRWIPEDSCALVEGCVSEPGWRRLLLFDASAVNVGGVDLDIGMVDYYEEGLGSDLLEHNVYQYSECDGHYHFRFYGDFRYGADGDQISNEQAFCVQATRRHFNNEATALVTYYDVCWYQGISAGWGDDYFAGLECQWLDVTGVDVPGGSVTHALSFEMNPEGFLCEGTPVVDEQGNQVFEPTSLVTEHGAPIDRPVCEQDEGWNANNLVEREVEIPKAGSFIQEPCPAGALGPGRDCGFVAGAAPGACTAGETVTLACQVPAGTAPHVVRVCEISEALGTGVACAHRQSVASAIVVDTPAEIAFPCPEVRDAAEARGGYSLYTAPVYGADAAGQVTCAPRP